MPRSLRDTSAHRSHHISGPRLRPDRRLAWLALVAMLLLFIGPLISQLQRLSEHERGGMLLSQVQAPLHDHSASGTGAHAPAAHGEMSHHAHALAACGYCVLFAHTPGLTPALLPLATPPAPAQTRPPAALSPPRSTAPYPAFAPRAPPRALLS